MPAGVGWAHRVLAAPPPGRLLLGRAHLLLPWLGTDSGSGKWGGQGPGHSHICGMVLPRGPGTLEAPLLHGGLVSPTLGRMSVRQRALVILAETSQGRKVLGPRAVSPGLAGEA